MHFTDQVNWSKDDFVIAGGIISFFGYLYNVLTKNSENRTKNSAIALFVFMLLALLWVNLI